MVKNDEGELIFLALEKVTKIEPHMAEIKAVEWASAIVGDLKLDKVVWLCDSMDTVNTVTSKEELCAWDTFLEATIIRGRFEANSCTMQWISRDQNYLVDAFAKFTLKNNFTFLKFDVRRDVISSCVKNFLPSFKVKTVSPL
ncbi:hypothetical protein FNV43_RR05913 [Rhamnella rubrinervis]|uniref:RNase H type-1 domain-containing protein n=1 Tax=Rhamnella rubrinervis TaxID=2594499 RepID=A0A8K0HDG1_9ROSA|nr:hypothetical protein FNV43_RR05913 [Rhamnella rubrinervis]